MPTTLALLAQLDAGMPPAAVLAALAATNGFFALRTDADALRAVDRRIERLLHPSREEHEVATAAALIAEYVRQLGWRAVELNARQWVEGAARAADAGSAPAAPLVALVLRVVCGKESLARPEFHRSVVVPSVTRLAAAAVPLLERPECALALFDALAEQMHIHASMLRPHVQRLHAACMTALFAGESDVAVVPATHLLATLPLSGAAAESPLTTAALLSGTDVVERGKVSQSQLWLTTATELLAGTRYALHAVLSQPTAGRPLGWAADDADPVLRIRTNLARLARLVGSSTSTHPGILLLFLAAPTPRAVPVPLGDLVELAHAMITAAPSHSTLAVEHARAEEWALPEVRLAGMRLLVHVVAAFGPASWRFVLMHDSAVLSAVCTRAERADATSPERLVAMRALRVLFATGDLGCAVPLDPAHSLVPRIGRVCVHAMGAYIANAPAVDADPLAKRAAFESDSVFLANRAAQDAIVRKSSVEAGITHAAATLFSCLVSTLLSSTAAGSPELVDIGVRVLVGLAEALIDARIVDLSTDDTLTLATAAVQGVARMVTTNAGEHIAQVLPRVHALCVRGIYSSIPAIRGACTDALQNVLLIIRPRLPPVPETVDSTATRHAAHSQRSTSAQCSRSCRARRSAGLMQSRGVSCRV